MTLPGRSPAGPPDGSGLHRTPWPRGGGGRDVRGRCPLRHQIVVARPRRGRAPDPRWPAFRERPANRGSSLSPDEGLVPGGVRLHLGVDPGGTLLVPGASGCPALVSSGRDRLDAHQTEGPVGHCRCHRRRRGLVMMTVAWAVAQRAAHRARARAPERVRAPTGGFD